METRCEKNHTAKDENNAEKNELPAVSKYRRALPQVLATSAKNLILLDLGMTLAFPTLVIPALLNSDQNLSFTIAQASWFGSIGFICQPIGSIISGTVLEPLGRRNSMLLVNIPHLIGWCLFYYGISVPILFFAAVMMGLGVGFMEAPVITYVGEISEPKLRGVLTSYSGIFVTVGLIVEFLLGTLYSWNTAALISAIVPVITIVAISQVPETPMWLLSKGRIKDAEQSLCWLRGWVPPALVQNELNELIRYSDASKLVLKDKPVKVKSVKKPSPNTDDDEKLRGIYCNPVVDIKDELPYSSKDRPDIAKSNGNIRSDVTTTTGENLTDPSKTEVNSASYENDKKSQDNTFEMIALTPSPNNVVESPETKQPSLPRKPTIKETIQDLMRPQMRRPLSLVIAFFIFHNGSGFPGVRPYMVKIFETLHFPIDAHWSTVIVSSIGFVGVIISTVFVPYVGKRVLTLVSLFGCASSILSLALWNHMHQDLPREVTSWTPFILFISYSFSFSFGIAPIPWMILSEVFPFRGRGFASGLAAAISYIMGFIASKTFLDLEMQFGLSGVFCLYGTITIVGILYVYFKLPETEGRSLEDIERYYDSKTKSKM